MTQEAGESANVVTNDIISIADFESSMPFDLEISIKYYVPYIGNPSEQA